MAYMHLCADGLGLGSCWVQVRNRQATEGGSFEEWLRKLFHFQESLKPLAILALGNRETHPAPYEKVKLNWDKVHWDRFEKC